MKQRGDKTFDLGIDTSGLDALLDQVVETVEEIAPRPVAQAMAQVLYDRVQFNVAQLGRKSGSLASSIYQAYSEDKSSKGVAVYHVSWNKRKAPHGHLLEWGYIQRWKSYVGSNGRWYTNKDVPLESPKHHPGFAFVRRAQAAEGEAVQAGKDKLLELVKEIS